jgi:hypothetical protein
MTVAHLALHDGDFPAARNAFAEAREHAQHFADAVSRAKELAAESIYVDAVAAVKAGLFEQAGELFGQWLTLFPERRGVYDLRFDSIRANELACVVLGNLLAGVDSVESLATLKRHLTTTNVPLPTWALYKRVQNIVAVAQLVPANVRPVIEEDGSLWTLFLTRTTLDESDRSSGQARTFTPPRFLDMSYLTSDHQRWQEILEQNVKNALLVLAEYERFRYEQPFEDEEHLPALTRVPTIGDTASAEDLLRLVRVYLERRDQRLVPQCDRARALVTEFAHAIRAQRFAEASEIHQQILKSFRFPHVVSVEDIQTVPRDHKSIPPISKFDVKFRRLWNREPRTLETHTLQPLERGEYYYLRPTWNTRLGERYPVNRDERFGIARETRWADALWRGLFAPRKVDAATFAEWIFQFRPSERHIASMLFDALDVYDEQRVMTEWAKAFGRLPPAVKRDAAFIGLGHTAKSGHSLIYDFRKGIARLPEYQALYRGREKLIFRSLAEFKMKVRGLPRPASFVFVDDFIGTGGQASDFITWYFKDDEFDFLREL